MGVYTTYTALDGRVYDLSGLNDEQLAFFERCIAVYRDDAPWITIARLVEGGENPLLHPTGGRVTLEVWDHPLFRAVRDLQDRVGIRQGMVAPSPGDVPERDPLEGDEWLTRSRRPSARA